jgi:4-amino-4-deoxy-L-arabinose transferase-like glycosyltransferase
MTTIFNRHRNIIAFILLLLLGALLRWFFISHTYHYLYWDEVSYMNLSKQLTSGHLAVDCCDKNMGYPLFLSIIFFLFRITNTGSDLISRAGFEAVAITQLFIDLTVAVLLYISTKELFRKNIAWTVFILYLFNPLTSSYAGFLLPEAVSIFLVAAIAYLLTRKSFLYKDVSWCLLGFILGVLVFLRYSLTNFAIGTTLLFVIFLFKKKLKIWFILIVTICFLLASSYTLIANKVKYQKLSLVPPYNMGTINLYLSFYMNRYPELVDDMKYLDPTYYAVNLEYHTTYYNYIDNVKHKYFQLFLQKFQKEWPVFMKNTVRNMFWIWDKEHLSVYVDPYYPGDRWAVRIYNIILMALFFLGIGDFIIKRKGWKHPLVIFSAGMFLYITCLFTLISNETRHSMIFYPIIFLWAGYGITKVFNRLHL